MEAVQHLPPHQQQAFMKEMEILQVKDSLSYVCLCVHSLVVCDFSFLEFTMVLHSVCSDRSSSLFPSNTQKHILHFQFSTDNNCNDYNGQTSKQNTNIYI
jgi:hypothetical protein